jgi:hypothetical protein
MFEDNNIEEILRSRVKGRFRKQPSMFSVGYGSREPNFTRQLIYPDENAMKRTLVEPGVRRISRNEIDKEIKFLQRKIANEFNFDPEDSVLENLHFSPDRQRTYSLRQLMGDGVVRDFENQRRAMTGYRPTNAGRQAIKARQYLYLSQFAEMPQEFQAMRSIPQLKQRISAQAMDLDAMAAEYIAKNSPSGGSRTSSTSEDRKSFLGTIWSGLKYGFKRLAPHILPNALGYIPYALGELAKNHWSNGQLFDNHINTMVNLAVPAAHGLATVLIGGSLLTIPFIHGIARGLFGVYNHWNDWNAAADLGNKSRMADVNEEYERQQGLGNKTRTINAMETAAKNATNLNSTTIMTMDPVTQMPIPTRYDFENFNRTKFDAARADIHQAMMDQELPNVAFYEPDIPVGEIAKKGGYIPEIGPSQNDKQKSYYFGHHPVYPASGWNTKTISGSELISRKPSLWEEFNLEKRYDLLYAPDPKERSGWIDEIGYRVDRAGDVILGQHTAFSGALSYLVNRVLGKGARSLADSMAKLATGWESLTEGRRINPLTQLGYGGWRQIITDKLRGDGKVTHPFWTQDGPDYITNQVLNNPRGAFAPDIALMLFGKKNPGLRGGKPPFDYF